MVDYTYGWFPGGDYDPRRFEPDRDVNSPEEIAAWERLCEAWNAGVGSCVFAPGLHEVGDGRVAFMGGSPLGMGTYEIDVPDDGPEPGAEEDIPAAMVA